MSVEDAREWFADVRWSNDGVFDPAALRAVCESLDQAGILERELVRNAEQVLLGIAGSSHAIDRGRS